MSTPQERSDTLRLRVPDSRLDRAIEVRPRAAEHPLFGVCDVVARPGGPPLACFQAVAWDHPRHLPAMDRPAALPPGAGSAILNHLARRAARHGTAPLRYVGPYPTSALFDALLTCFRIDGPVAEARARFTADVEELAFSGAMREVAVDFWPDPFKRSYSEPDVSAPGVRQTPVCVQIRDGVEAIYIGARAYSRAPTPRHGRRVVAEAQPAGERAQTGDGQRYRAVIEIAGTIWADVARVDGNGGLLDGPHPLPIVDNALVGKPLPAGVRRALISALPARAPGLMRPVLARMLADMPMVWADTGDVLARYGAGRAEVHAILPEMYAETSAMALLDTLARALEPVLQQVAQTHIAHAWNDDDGPLTGR